MLLVFLEELASFTWLQMFPEMAATAPLQRIFIAVAGLFLFVATALLRRATLAHGASANSQKIVVDILQSLSFKLAIFHAKLSVKCGR